MYYKNFLNQINIFKYTYYKHLWAFITSFFSFQPSSVLNSPTPLEGANSAKTGAREVSLKCARSTATRGSASRSPFRSSTLVELKASGARPTTLHCPLYIRLAPVSHYPLQEKLYMQWLLYNCNFTTLRTAAKPAQRVFKVNMLFPTSVLCNEAGQGVLRQKVKTAINLVNRDWNFCSYSVEGIKFHIINYVCFKITSIKRFPRYVSTKTHSCNFFFIYKHSLKSNW